TQPRLSLALHEVSARARSHWHFQSQLLRGNLSGAGASGNFGEPEAAARARHKRHLEGTLSGHPRLRAIPGAQWRGDSQVLSAHYKREEKEAFSRADRRTGEKLEVFEECRQGARTLG